MPHRAGVGCESAGPDPYERVYAADSSELFFKSAAWRVSGPGDPVAVRSDSTVDVPEPELAVVVTASGEMAGYTLCNGMSSRSIQGENPLCLPQVKVSAGNGAVLSTGAGIVPDLAFRLEPGDVVTVSAAEIGELTNPRSCAASRR